MSSNSQFQQLRQQVKLLSAELERVKNNQGSSADIEAQKQMLQTARQQQTQAKQTLLNPHATADELEHASNFLPSRGLQEQARMDARDKRMAEELKAFSQQRLVLREDLIGNAVASSTSGDYQLWRESMKRGEDETFTSGRRLPNGKTRPSANAMKSAQMLTRNQYEAQQRKMNEARNRPIGAPAKKTPSPTMPTPLANWF